MSEKWKDVLKGDPVPWLLKSNPWTKYKTMTDIIEISANEIEHVQNELANNPKVNELINKTQDWMPFIPGRNNDPKISYYLLRILADFGFTIENARIMEIVKKAIEYYRWYVCSKRNNTKTSKEG